MKHAYKTGDLVQLKSEGPIMTVESLLDDIGGMRGVNTIRCQWFAGKKLESGDFPEESLKPATIKAKEG